MSITLNRAFMSGWVDDTGDNVSGTITDLADWTSLADTIDTQLAKVSVSLDDTGRVRLAASTELTIATGVVTATGNRHSIDTQANAASDDLDTITAGSGVQDGHILILKAENVARVVTLKDGTGNLILSGDYAMNATDRSMMLYYNGASWVELSRGTVASSIPNPITQSLLFTDATYDIGASGATRPRDLFLSRNVVVGGTIVPQSTTASTIATAFDLTTTTILTLADDATATIALTSGFILIYEATNTGEMAMFAINNSVSRVVNQSGTNWAAADTDTKLCVYAAAGTTTVKNRIGGSATFRIEIHKFA